MSSPRETGWLADFIYTGGRLQSGLAMFANQAGEITRFSSDPSDLKTAQRLPNRVILPGLVNAHSHAFQRLIRGRTEHRTAAQQDTFWTWRESMYRAVDLVSPEAVYYSARMAFLEMLLSGITTVGEFHYLHHAPSGVPYRDRNFLALQVLRAALQTGIRIVLLQAAYVRAGWQKPPDARQARFITPRVEDFLADTDSLRSAVSDSPRASIGVAPHSIRAVPLDYLLAVARFAQAERLPVHMHAAEQPAEVEACLAEYRRRPIELLAEQDLLDSRFTAIHAIHIDDGEVQSLANARATVCACPTTERNLGDGIAPADRLLNAGVDIALGSDSNVEIDLLQDARSLEYHLRLQKLERAVLANGGSADALAARLLSAATEAGSRSLAAPGGKLEVGRPADFFTVDLEDPSIAGASTDTLLSNIVFSLQRTAIRDVCVAGEFVIRDGRHALQDKIVREFAAAQKAIWSEA